MKFSYRELEVVPSPASLKRKTIFRPIIPIFLISPQKIVGYEALIDSGADFNVFDAGIADILGIKLTAGNKRQIIGLGGQRLKGYEHQINLKIGPHHYKTKALFSREIAPNSFGILGSIGFFDHFSVLLNFRKKVIETKYINPN